MAPPTRGAIIAVAHVATSENGKHAPLFQGYPLPTGENRSGWLATASEGSAPKVSEPSSTSTAPTQEVALAVEVILAHGRDHFIDDRLKPLEARLRKSFDFTHYVRLDRVEATAELGKRVRLHLPQGHFLRLLPAAVDERGRLRIHVELEDHFASDFRLSPRGALLIGGPKLGRNGTMILAVTGSWTVPQKDPKVPPKHLRKR